MAPPFLELYGGEREYTHGRDSGGARAQAAKSPADPAWSAGFRLHPAAGPAHAVDDAGRVPRLLSGPNQRAPASKLVLRTGAAHGELPHQYGGGKCGRHEPRLRGGKPCFLTRSGWKKWVQNSAEVEQGVATSFCE